jgi:hypothetical protein
MVRLRGRCPRGERLIGYAPHRAPLLLGVQSFFEADVAAIEETPNSAAAARDPSLLHHHNDLVQRQVRLCSNQAQQKFRVLFQRGCAAATRLCRDAPIFFEPLRPNHHHTGADPIAFRRLAPCGSCYNFFTHSGTQVAGIGLRHRFLPKVAECKVAECRGG